MKCQFLVTYLAAVLLLASTLSAQGPVFTDPQMADEDYAVQGEYVGQLPFDEGVSDVGVQIIALGKGQFEAVAYKGGLPGAGWDQGEAPQRYPGQREGGEVVIKGDEGRGIVRDGKIVAQDGEGNTVGMLERIERKSPTLGKEPPADAVVLFSGQDTEHWVDGKKTEDGLLMAGTTSRDTFGSLTLHIEFLLPYQPEARGQGRGNSGIYIQGRYEIQMLDSFGLEGKDNECGGIYSVRAPTLNMCLPPLSWQTYDIDYTAASYDDAGNVTSNPRITVHHNGVVIHDNIELPGDRTTAGAPVGISADQGPIYLQDHGNPVRYRNIWVVPK